MPTSLPGPADGDEWQESNRPSNSRHEAGWRTERPRVAVMALIHDATITPTKLELLAAWLPGRPWFPGGELRKVGAYRFDDPAGEVGIETLLVAAGNAVVQAPLTYRGGPLDGAERHLLGTMEHSVLGTRWIYDGCGDPVWAAALTTAVLTGGTQAEELEERDGELVPRTPSATAQGSGAAETPVPGLTIAVPHDEDGMTVVATGPLTLLLARVVGTPIEAEDTLTVTWDGGTPTVAAGVVHA
jgi:hypothetical protein